MKIKVSNMTSSNGNDIPNQFIIKTEAGTYFQSYESVIAFEPNNIARYPDENTPDERKIQLDKNYWDYSKTTGKYRNQFLGETKKETQENINSGVYILTDLNPND
jgi:hypothetical protein